MKPSDICHPQISEAQQTIDGLRIGEVTDNEHHTGCTVVLAEKGAVAAVDVRGGAPGTHGTDALRPENLVDRLHAVVLTGGSSKIEGLVELSEEIFHMPVRLGTPQYVTGLLEVETAREKGAAEISQRFREAGGEVYRKT